MRNNFKKILVCLLIVFKLFGVTNVYALTKNENVYVKLKSNGEVDNISIFERLSNYNGDTINDKTILNNIKNVNGNEKFKKSNNDIIWNTNGNDIYYEGSYNGSLPISVEVKYYLNGEEKNVSQILGKKGKIKIVLTYKNNLCKKTNFGGNNENIYAFYTILTTSILDNKNNKNINVKNGKIIDNGVNSFVIALSFPGLYESLDIDQLKDINRVEISYDTDNFKLNTIYSVATSNLFDGNNFDIFDNMNKLYNNVDLLQSNMNTIVEQSKKLSDGSNQINNGITEFNNKAQELTKKYKYYRNQDKNILKENFIALIEDNMNIITPYLEEEITNEASKIIKENKEELEKAVVFYTKKNIKLVIDEEANKVINELNINSLIGKVINSNLYNLLNNDPQFIELNIKLKKEINKELKSIIDNEIDKINDCIEKNVSYDEKYINDIAIKYDVTYEQALGIVGQVQSDTLNQVKINSSYLEGIMNELNDKDSVSILIDNYVNELSSRLNELLNDEIIINEYSKELKRMILEAIKKDLENQSMYINTDVKEYISNLVNKIIDDTAMDLSRKYTEEYTNKVVKNLIEKEFKEGNIDSNLRKIMDIYEMDINERATILDNTVNTLTESLNKLNDGSNQVSNGMNLLSTGLDKYNKEGINKLSNIFNGNVKKLLKKADLIIDFSNENNAIDTVPTDAKSNSKIIFMIDSMFKEDKTKVRIKNKEKRNSFWDKIKGLFN